MATRRAAAAATSFVTGILPIRMPVVHFGAASVVRVRFVAVAACCAVALAVASACAERERTEGAQRRDDFGHPIAVGAPPRRIVSLNPTTTEILFAIGAGDRLVGRSRWDLYPAAARAVPELGDAIRPSVETILAARPDLVVLYASADNRAAAERLRAAGIATLGLKIDLIEEFDHATRLLGQLTGDSARAATVADTVLATLDSVRARTAALPRPTVFWHIWDAPLITIGRGSFLHQLVEIAGGENIYAFSTDVSPAVSLEDVARRDPRYVLAGPDNAGTLRSSPAWRAVPAVSAGRILVVDTTIVARPSVTLGAAAASLARLLHPELLEAPVSAPDGGSSKTQRTASSENSGKPGISRSAQRFPKPKLSTPPEPKPPAGITP